MPEETLDQLAVLFNTDKSSLSHDYVRHYQRAFEQFRHEPIQVIEIGIAGGASLRLWQTYFTAATLIGVDIIPGCKRWEGGRIRVEIGSQGDAAFLSGLANKYRPTIVIDDGSHQADHIALTFRHLFPRLEAGGCYVIEDLNFFSSSGQPRHPTGALASLLDVAARVVHSHYHQYGDDVIARLTDSVDRIEFVRHAALIWKKPLEDPADAIATMRDLVERSGAGQNWFNFIPFILRRGGSLELAEFAARKAVELVPRDAVGLAYWRLSEVLERRGDLAASLDAAHLALRYEPDQADIKIRVDRLTAIVGSRAS